MCSSVEKTGALVITGTQQRALSAHIGVKIFTDLPPAVLVATRATTWKLLMKIKTNHRVNQHVEEIFVNVLTVSFRKHVGDMSRSIVFRAIKDTIWRTTCARPIFVLAVMHSVKKHGKASILLFSI